MDVFHIHTYTTQSRCNELLPCLNKYALAAVMHLDTENNPAVPCLYTPDILAHYALVKLCIFFSSLFVLDI